MRRILAVLRTSAVPLLAFLMAIGSLFFLWFSLLERVPSEMRRALDGDSEMSEKPFLLERRPGRERKRAVNIRLFRARGNETSLFLYPFYEKKPVTDSVWILQKLGDASCRFTSVSEDVRVTKERIRFELTSNWNECASNSATWELRFQKDAGVKAGFWGWTSENPSISTGPRAVVWTSLQGAERMHAFLKGHYGYSSSTPNATRLELLSWHWFGSLTDARVPLLAGISSVVIFFGLTMLAWCEWRSMRGRFWKVLRLAGVVFIMPALCAVWAILTPPLQAPDEPDHLLAYSKSLSSPQESRAFDAALEGEARRVHFERIKFRESETFNAAFLDEPYPAAWSRHVAGYDVSLRSPLFASLFGWVDELNSGLREPFATLATFRFIQWVLLSVSVVCVSFVSSGVFQRNTEKAVGSDESPSPLVSGLVPLLIAPSLVFFSVQLSNYSFLIVGTLFLVHLFIAPRKSMGWAAEGTLLAMGVCLSVLSGRNGLPALGFPVLYAFLRAAKSFRLVQHWCLAGMLSIVLILFLPAEFFGYLGFVGRAFGSEFLTGKITAISLVVASFGAGFCAEWLLKKMESRFPDWKEKLPSHASLARVLCVVLLAFIVISSVLKMSPLANVERRASHASLSYFWEVIPRFVLNLGFNNPDPYLSQSFWSGFGWLDVNLPRRLLRVLKSVPLVAAVALFVWALFKPVSRVKLVTPFLCVIAATAIIGMQALAIAQEDINLHGRYLSVSYFLILGGTLIPLLQTFARSKKFKFAPFVVLCLGVALHAYSLKDIVERYFL